MAILDREILVVRLGQLLGCRSADIVTIHEEGHIESLRR
jgi:hypothetical protein